MNNKYKRLNLNFIGILCTILLILFLFIGCQMEPHEKTLMPTSMSSTENTPVYMVSRFTGDPDWVYIQEIHPIRHVSDPSAGYTHEQNVFRARGKPEENGRYYVQCISIFEDKPGG